MSRDIIVVGGSRNVRSAALTAAICMILTSKCDRNVVVADDSVHDRMTLGMNTHYDYHHNEVYRRLVDEHDKYTLKTIEARHKSLMKRHEQRKRDIARKSARNRQMRFVRGKK